MKEFNVSKAFRTVSLKEFCVSKAYALLSCENVKYQRRLCSAMLCAGVISQRPIQRYPMAGFNMKYNYATLSYERL